MAVGLQNRIRTSVMPRVISRRILLQKFYEFATVETTDIRYSIIHITAIVNHVIVIMYLH